jgi:hypothetical protein
MRIPTHSILSVLCPTIALLFSPTGTHGQEDVRRVALKSGETVELRDYSFVQGNCVSIMVGTPGLDILQGPEEVTVTLKEEPVIRRDRGCSAPVPGGKVVATAGDIKEPKEAKLTIRLNYKTKDGPRQSASVYLISLFPN